MRESLENQIDKAFRHAVSDPQFKEGVVLKNKYDFHIKRFVVELYERATERSILKETSSDETAQRVTGQMQSKEPSPGSESDFNKASKKRDKKTSTEHQPPIKKFSLRSNRKEGL